MIFTAFEGRAYRVLPARTAFEPLNASGAACEGGRFNRPGTAALYLSLEQATAHDAYAPCDHAYAPGEMAAYRLRIARVADLSQGYSPKWDPLWDAWCCDWKELAFIRGIEPPTWTMGDRLRRMGVAALMFPTPRGRQGVNMVVYPDLIAEPDRLCMDDPHSGARNTGRW